MWKDAESFLLKDKYIGPLIEKWGSCTIKFRCYKDYFEHICGNIIGQQLSGRVADVIEERFKKAVGGKVTPNSVLEISDQKLRNCGMSWGKVGFLKDLALKTKNGDLKTKKLPELTDEEVIRELIAVKGIGRWTAEMLLMFSLARPDVFPVDDLGIKKGFEKVTGRKWDKVGSPKFAEKKWKPYRTVASWYLWRSLESS
jgi:DNA-3-methyladenine glycosylase II